MNEYNIRTTKTPRPRDFYDIYTVGTYYQITFDHEEKEMLYEIFSIKKVPLSLLTLIPHYFDFHAQALDSLLSTLPADKREGFDFKIYFDYVIKLTQTFIQET